MEIIIDNYDFYNIEAQKYWSFPASYSQDRRKKEAKEMVLSEKFLGSRKMDGSWEMIIRDNEGNFHARSRTESVNGGFQDKAEWLPHIIEELDFLPNNSAVIGEIYFPDNEGSRKITSVFNCLKDKCIERQKKNGWLHFYIFDIIAYDGKSLLDTKFIDRIKLLNSLPRPHNFIEFAEYKTGKELWELYYQILAAGGEGIVIVNESAPYRPGKRKARETLKIKQQLSDTIDAFLDGDYKPATRLYNGKEIETWPYWHNPKTNKFYNTCQFASYSTGTSSVEPITKAYYYGWASAVSFSVMKDGKPVHIGYISGITDELKEGIVKNPEKWIGKVAALQAMMVEKIDGNYSLRHARIDCWRNDKQKEDCDFSQITSS